MSPLSLRGESRWRLRAALISVALTVCAVAAPVLAPRGDAPAPPPAVAEQVSAPHHPAAAGDRSVPPARRAVSRPWVRSVLVVSIDGLNPDAITALGPSQAPHLHRLIAEGAATLNARTEFESTQTLPNHTGMVTGRPVSTDIGGHGVTFNEDNGGTVRATAGEKVRSAFSAVHRAGGRTALFASKPKFDFLDRSWPTAIDKYRMEPDNKRLTRLVLRDLRRQRRTFRFVHFSAPDTAGHASSYMSADYLEAVRKTDHRLGRLMGAIDETRRLRRHLLLVVTSDHGGLGTSHADATRRYNYTMPFFVWGRGIEGADLYDLNPQYADPGASRPDYAGAQPIRNGMVANLVTQLLSLKAVPGSRFNTAQDVRVFD